MKQNQDVFLCRLTSMCMIRTEINHFLVSSPDARASSWSHSQCEVSWGNFNSYSITQSDPGPLEIPKWVEYQIYDISLVVSHIWKFLQKPRVKQCFGWLDLLKSGVTKHSPQWSTQNLGSDSVFTIHCHDIGKVNLHAWDVTVRAYREGKQYHCCQCVQTLALTFT